jgi:hypothetical protein
MPRLLKLLLLLLVFGTLLFCGSQVVLYGIQVYLSRTPVQLADLPVYPGALDVRYTPCDDRALANCSMLAYSVNASPAEVHALYEEHLRAESTFPKRLWLGDGTRYPPNTIVNYYNDGEGFFQVLTLTTLHRRTGVEVSIVLFEHQKASGLPHHA